MLRGVPLALILLAPALAPALGPALGPALARADETSATDKLRILYSTRFTFTDAGLPLVTIEIVSGRQAVHLHARGGVTVRPDGAGGSSIENDGGEDWTITALDARPAVRRDWTVVETLAPDDTAGVAAAIARWKARGFEPRSFEIGTVFGTGGEVIDTRELRIAVDPVAAGKGAARAAEIARRFGIATQVHEDLVRRPSGMIVARSGAVTIRNPSVLWFQPRKPGETLAVADVPAVAGGSQRETGSEERRYWGSVYVTLDHEGALVAANAVAEDKLLAGLLPAEMYPDAPAAALEAQAIAARTELLQKIGRRSLTDPFLLCSTQQCQVYAGAGKEDPRTTKAVEATRGMVLLRNGGGLADVRYSASCGGHGEDNDAIWGGEPDPSLRGRSDDKRDAASGGMSRITDDNLAGFLDGGHDAWCNQSRLGKAKFRWTEQISQAELTARVALAYPEIGRVRRLVARKRGVSGRIGVLAIESERTTIEVSGDLHIRRLLGGLKSTLFEVTRQGDVFVIRGAGYGHGVGMCQLGAIGMAGARKSYADILAHYYRGSRVHRLY